MAVRRRLVLAILPLASLARLPAQAGEFAQGPPAPGMALTRADPGMANSVPAGLSDPAASPLSPQIDPGNGRRLGGPGGGFPPLKGQLPNQRTGSRHQHVVHDICIGC
ncbi:hypothetical protein MKK69_18950 [Methylobacterium sp. J-026]|uniref:hypothetical protein n=1 Tax=Methylobacterium sp. J-026 TaxID=2836624 RepID=UPI001FBBEB74|nr:hypothetical protein [Methylobacterium sp. J-026]MCJ2136101.1 hypothetical protein [Methylobacterium sp. J-026]